MTAIQESSYTYSMLNSGIHSLRLLDTRKKTVESVLSILQSVLNSNHEPVVRVLVHFELLTFPMIQLFFAYRAAILKALSSVHLRTAYLHDDPVMARIAFTLATLQRVRPEDQMRFFPKYERDDAILWLLEGAALPPVDSVL